MAMKKADMEWHHAEYARLMGLARAAQRQGLHRDAVSFALATWDHIDGMMQFARKYEERAFTSVESLDLVLKWTPPLLDFESLNSLESLLERQRRIERDTTDDMGARLEQAKLNMSDAHRLWGYIENHPQCRQDSLASVLGGDQRRWRAIAEAWDELGLITRTADRASYLLSLGLRLGQVVWAKCSACGHKAEAPKAMFLEDVQCHRCRQKRSFVILG